MGGAGFFAAPTMPQALIKRPFCSSSESSDFIALRASLVLAFAEHEQLNRFGEREFLHSVEWKTMGGNRVVVELDAAAIEDLQMARSSCDGHDRGPT